MISRVVVNNPSSNVDIKYDYEVPSNLVDIIKIGTRVKVPFGNGNRALMGYVVELSDETTYDKRLKQIIDVVDLEPIITKTQLELAEYIKKDTVCPLIRAINLMVPDILLLKPTKYIKVNDYQNLDANLAEAFKGKKIITYTSALAPYTSKIKKAIDNHLLEISYDAVGLNAVKQVTKYVLDMNKYYMYADNFRSDIQPLIRMLEGLEPLTKIELSDRTDLSVYTIQKMIKLELLVPVKQNVSRIKTKEIPVTDRFIKANSLYDNTVAKLMADSTKPSLWCPSSIIETEMVIERIIRNNVEKNQNTLIICPDILSSYRMASVVRKKTNLSVAILNSNLSKGEYYDTVMEIKNNSYRVVVTTTKGAFVDYPNLKTVILLDSENDNYYNDQSPRYNLKKIMMKYQEIINCELIFHSYSPLLEDYILGVKGYLNIVDNKVEDNINCEVVNLKLELLNGNNSMISSRLLKEMKLSKIRNKQTLIITNRKYFSNFVMCRSCGEILKCPRCDLPLHYSKNSNQLMCPTCSYRTSKPDKCPKCDGETFRMEGSGMEQLVSDINELLPDFKTITVDNPNYDEFIDKMCDVEDNKIDVIIATDVYSRSIVDKNIGLVVIINLDEVAGTASYLASERAYTMLIHASQKVLNSDTKLLIQTYDPNNFVITSFITGKYQEYLKKEINNRKELKNPPFYYINRILVKAKYEEMFKEANTIKKLLQEMLGYKAYIIGPTYNHLHQAAQLIIKHQLNNIEDIYNKIYDKYQNSTIVVIVDRYPRYM